MPGWYHVKSRHSYFPHADRWSPGKCPTIWHINLYSRLSPLLILQHHVSVHTSGSQHLLRALSSYSRAYASPLSDSEVEGMKFIDSLCTAVKVSTCRSLLYFTIMANATRHYHSDRAVLPYSLSTQPGFPDCEVDVGFLRWYTFCIGHGGDVIKFRSDSLAMCYSK